MAKAKTIEIVRLANPWFVGQYVNRIVPIFLVHNLVARLYSDKPETTKILQVCKGAPQESAKLECFTDKQPNEVQLDLLQRSMFATFSPDRRVFGNSKGDPQGSPTPILANIASKTASDDGLGNRVFELLRDCLGSSWRNQLGSLMEPAEYEDPVSALAACIAGRSNRERAPVLEQDEPREDITPIENSVSSFIDSLFRRTHAGNRIASIEDFGRGAYFGALLLLITLAIEKYEDERCLLFVYGGRPPGAPDDFLVQAAGRSFRRVIRRSAKAVATGLSKELVLVDVPKAIEKKDHTIFRFRQLLTHLKPVEIEAIIKEVTEADLENKELPDQEWCEQLLENVVGLNEAEFARRVRGLGGHVGFSGPRRGRGIPRLFFETPLLGTLVRGICGQQSMPFEDFVDELRSQLGLVVGIGTLEAAQIDVGHIFGPANPDEVLRQNEEILRRRLVRSGLARTYSDSHTEVVANDS